MSAHPLPPLPVALPPDKAALLARLVDGLEPAALWWLSGYSAGLAGSPAAVAERATAAPREAVAVARASVAYGSQTGNARRVAERLARDLEAAGSSVRLVRADAYPLRELADERLLYVVVSTQGDGDPPDDARGFFEHLESRRAPRLEHLRFAVLGLGDSSYPQFNAAGRRLDERLAALGGERLFALGEADLDIDTVATPWARQAIEQAKTQMPARATVVPLRAASAPPAASREQPFAAEVLANQRITARDALRDVRHLELSLEGSGLRYEPGDALGVWPRNEPALVEDVLSTLDLDGDAGVSLGNVSLPLREWLAAQRELTRLARPFVAAHAALRGDAALNRLLAPGSGEALARLLGSHQLIDLLREFPARWGADELVAALRPLAPRLYSIASSRLVVGDEAHLAVAVAEWQAFGHAHRGAASSHLADRREGERARVFIEPNERFRLPADGSRDLVMIGAGTGIAPYRGFLQQRAATGARGRHWLFFGNRHLQRDFLYQLEWQEALREGRLHRLDLAFSRDQEQRVHVPQRLREQGRELYAWIEGGAHLYVCGDAAAMARDVHAALVDVIATHGGHGRERATEILDDLQREGRHARDVY